MPANFDTSCAECSMSLTVCVDAASQSNWRVGGAYREVESVLGRLPVAGNRETMELTMPYFYGSLVN